MLLLSESDYLSSTGLGVSMARSCAINTIFFSCFEYVKKRINNMPDPLK